MKQKFMRKVWVPIVVFGILFSLAEEARSQDTNALEIIKRLEKRIEDLEHKVKSLEGATSPSGTKEDKTRPQFEGLRRASASTAQSFWQSWGSRRRRSSGWQPKRSSVW